MASLRHRPEMVEAEDYDRGSYGDGTAADSSATEEEEEEDHRLHLHLGLDSMTAKGIQHLCSELLEIKKASEQDFRANVYLSYLSFIRMFQEAGALEKDLHQHVLAHRRLVQHLGNNYLQYPSSIVLGTAIPVAADDHHHEDELELELELELDVLLSEHRMEEALEFLELQGQALQKITAADASKARIADRFASVADNTRTPRPELLKALSGLCKLGDAQRANHLLFKFYRPAIDSLLKKKKKKKNNYIKDLACMVFSSILEASRSFVSLHGHPSPYTPQLIRWAREEMEDFSVAFSEYVKSTSQVGQSVVLALEAAKCAHSYCALLRPLHVIASEQDLLDLLAPCLHEVLTVYARHLKEVTRLFVESDSWVLGRFPVSGILLVSPAVDTGLHIEYCLLTASGRKFLTLIQDVVEDLYPLLELGINNSVLQLLAELFREYMHSIVELIPEKEVALKNEDHQYMWQLSILINCTTLVSLFPIIAHAMFKSDQPSVVTDFLTKGYLDSLIVLIKEAAGQVWTCFCQQFIRDTMSIIQRSGEGIASSPQGMMPSFPFQVLFGRVRQLNNLYGTILTGKDGAMKKLLQELMEAMIFWLSNNLDSWIHHAQGIPKDTLFQQIQLDVHFLLEFAQLGRFSSENIRTCALDLLTKAEEKVSEHDTKNSGAREGRDWAIDAAKHAVGVLMKTNRFSPHQEASVQNAVGAQEEGEDIAENYQEGHMYMDAPDENHERGACDGGKSSDEFISIEEDDDDSMLSEELKLGWCRNHHQAAPDEYSEIDGDEERTISNHAEAAQVCKDHDDNAGGGDHESVSSGENPDAIEVEVEEDDVSGDHDENSCELVLLDKTRIQEMVGGGGSEGRRRRQASTARLHPPIAAAAQRSRRKRDAVTSRPRWQ